MLKSQVTCLQEITKRFLVFHDWMVRTMSIRASSFSQCNKTMNWRVIIKLPYICMPYYWAWVMSIIRLLSADMMLEVVYKCAFTWTVLHQVHTLPHKWPHSRSCCLHLPNQVPDSVFLSLLRAKSHKMCLFQTQPKIQLAQASTDSRSVAAYVPSVSEDSPWHRRVVAKTFCETMWHDSTSDACYQAVFPTGRVTNAVEHANTRLPVHMSQMWCMLWSKWFLS